MDMNSKLGQRDCSELVLNRFSTTCCAVGKKAETHTLARRRKPAMRSRFSWMSARDGTESCLEGTPKVPVDANTIAPRSAGLSPAAREPTKSSHKIATFCETGTQVTLKFGERGEHHLAGRRDGFDRFPPMAIVPVKAVDSVLTLLRWRCRLVRSVVALLSFGTP
jgi:hypothetical protein